MGDKSADDQNRETRLAAYLLHGLSIIRGWLVRLPSKERRGEKGKERKKEMISNSDLKQHLVALV